jgi:hypothetical protein
MVFTGCGLSRSAWGQCQSEGSVRIGMRVDYTGMWAVATGVEPQPLVSETVALGMVHPSRQYFLLTSVTSSVFLALDYTCQDGEVLSEVSRPL